MLLSEFDYHLPFELIAQEPLADRAGARMLVIHRKEGTWEDRMFRDFPSYLKQGDCLILNDSRVFPSRLFGRREQGEKLHKGRVEIFLTKQISSDGLTWTALVRPGRKMRTGERIRISDELTAEILAHGEHGERTVRMLPKGELFEILERTGHVPLPPYIHRPDTAADRERYQTVFARERGSVAAPTAGLHFTPEVLAACTKAGAVFANVTLHVGLGTFQPIYTDVIEKVQLHTESFRVPPETVRAMEHAQEKGARVIAIGTTSVRAIESAALPSSQPGVIPSEGTPSEGTAGEGTAGEGTPNETNLFISPGFQFRRTQAMLTNFHLPKSSLLVLVCAFAGRELTLSAYEHAVREKYRFFSYGDCMLIL